jgi:hypothetical protein
MTHTFRYFLLWLGETFLTILVSIDMKFDLNEFRVWSLWCLSIILGVVQLVGRQTVKDKIGHGWKKFTRIFRR